MSMVKTILFYTLLSSLVLGDDQATSDFIQVAGQMPPSLVVSSPCLSAYAAYQDCVLRCYPPRNDDTYCQRIACMVHRQGVERTCP